MYVAGFIDLQSGKFFGTGGQGHNVTAKDIIEKNPYLCDLFNNEIYYTDAVDFLIFRANFAQVGNGGRREISVRASSPYKRHLKELIHQLKIDDYKVWELIR